MLLLSIRFCLKNAITLRQKKKNMLSVLAYDWLIVFKLCFKLVVLTLSMVNIVNI